ncbi:hypothetical protein [Photobacterium ganghwense]|uniref:hypothetical protein n=1 Tax=Photobacterium ganghwense TaxID=320778 RepID=UPI001A8EE3BB|nr:hypothetical protein [Photobacterium ganghwense]QSV17311.1 hypothetical protein FH974_20500 [Photobacterium ganghwense]
MKNFMQKYFSKQNIAVATTVLISSGMAMATAENGAGPSATDFDSLKEAILTLIAGLGASAIAIMVASQGWTIALGIAKKFFSKAS